MRYPTVKKEFDLGKYGNVVYNAWQHPWEQEKSFTEEQITLTRKLVRPGSVAIDIGAHTGDSTLPLMVAAGKTGKILAFEPNPTAFEVLLRNIYDNIHLCRASVLQLAIMEAFGEYTFHYTDLGAINGGFATGISAGIGYAGNTYPVDVIGWNLHNFLRRDYAELIPRISFIKIDAEGYDKNILATLPGLIAEIHAGGEKPLIQTELYDGLTLAERGELWRAIGSIGYDTYDFAHADRDLSKCTIPLTEDQLLYMPARSGHDLLLLPKEYHGTNHGNNS